MANWNKHIVEKWKNSITVHENDPVEVVILKKMMLDLNLTSDKIAKDLDLAPNTIYRILHRETTRGINVYVMAIAFYYNYKGDLSALTRKES